MENIISQINEKLEYEYNIQPTKIQKNKESTAGNVYIVDENKYVIKIYDNIEHVQQMCKLHDFLISFNMHIPKIIYSINNMNYIKILDNKYMVVYSFLDGKQLVFRKDEEEYNESIINIVAKTLRKMHDITGGENKFNLNKVPFRIDSDRNSVLHFDLTKKNIFINMNSKIDVGFIDFDDAKYGASVCDVAIAMVLIFFTKTNGADIKGANKFINEYYGKDVELKYKELPIIKECALEWIDYTLENNDFEPSTKDSFLIKKMLIENINTIL